ncbi:MAG: hypothetical protein K0Q70_2902, partial [Rhodospirillales bacterium]|nr:hypothetical protein [Rhodospirillales bacterium]
GIGLWIARARRGLKRPPDEILRRVGFEARALLDRTAMAPDAAIDDRKLVFLPYPGLSDVSPLERKNIRAVAERARSLVVDLLGSGPVGLARPIDWHIDFKSGHRWTPGTYFRDLDLNDLGRDSDVKVPWELSRLQWLIPVGQDYALGGDPSHADFARDILVSWMEANPFARSVNWGIAMEPAMRIFTWTWLFQTFGDSAAWREPIFRRQFLATLYRHGEFVSRYVEDFGSGGNHLVADASGLVMLGLFFGETKGAAAWMEQGWSILTREIVRQVGSDGVDYEASMAYHGFVADLFAWPARVRAARGLDVPEVYRTRLAAMEAFARAATGPDGAQPLWGDNDDGKVLPISASRDRRSEPPASHAFHDAGVYIMADGPDHVFIDCGPIGQAGRGGHGHNDALSFEAVLNGVRLITDSGSYVYTASPMWRDRFRSALAHNAPIVDGEEPNRFVGENELFLLHDDAKAKLITWRPAADRDTFVGTHHGYDRLVRPVRPIRTIELDKRAHRLTVRDAFEGGGDHKVVTTLHFAFGCVVVHMAEHRWRIEKDGATFELTVDGEDWETRVVTTFESPSYGVKRERPALEFSRSGHLTPLGFTIAPLG